MTTLLEYYHPSIKSTYMSSHFHYPQQNQQWYGQILHFYSNTGLYWNIACQDQSNRLTDITIHPNKPKPKDGPHHTKPWHSFTWAPMNWLWEIHLETLVIQKAIYLRWADIDFSHDPYIKRTCFPITILNSRWLDKRWGLAFHLTLTLWRLTPRCYQIWPAK